MDIHVRSRGFASISGDDRVVLSGQNLKHADFSGRRLAQFSSDGCRFESCTFDSLDVQSGAFGAGRRVSVYLNCTFNGSKLRMGPGGLARFVDCSFEGAVIQGWFCFAVELVDCTFSGQLKKAVFNGTVPMEKRDLVGRSTNQFEGNDFSQARLLDVAFRTGIDLGRQQLPEGDEYVLLSDAVDAVRRARRAFEKWDASEQKLAAGVLMTMEKDAAAGQRSLLVRVADYSRASRPSIRALLDAAQGPGMGG